MPWGTLTENCPFLENPSSRNLFLLTEMVSTILWTITLFLADINKTLLSQPFSFGKMTWTTFWTKKISFFKTILTWKVVLQFERSSMAYVIARSRRIMRTKKRTKRKIDCRVTHLKNSIESKRKLRKPNSKKNVLKKMKNYNLFLLQGFALQFR